MAISGEFGAGRTVPSSGAEGWVQWDDGDLGEQNEVLTSNGADLVKRDGNDDLVHGR